MEIVLLRHGMPEIDNERRLSAVEFGRWVLAYNEAGINVKCMPSQDAMEQAKKCAFVVCSNLPRSSESAKALGLKGIDACESMFRELDMPQGNWRFPRLSPAIWAVVFRLIWIVGYSKNAESFREAKKRAHSCAQRLTELASEHDKVLFVGHGLLNWFVSRQLKSMGWAGPQKAPRKYWEYGVYRYHAT
ncbi:MAG: histidine phosphatase family protein [Glaciimonas sp.]|nr:histidine phosphatase family protein [Glaciimonas sp.]